MNRREAIKAVAVVGAGATAMAMPATQAAAGCDKAAFVLVHGSWHGAWTWNEMTPLLAEAGHASVAL